MQGIKLFSRALAFFLSAVLFASAPAASANGDASFYELIDGGCITDTYIKARETIHGGIDYFSGIITSHIQGVPTNSAIPYEVYGAIGSSETRMFVYSVGTNDDLDYARHTVKEILEVFEKNNPAWDAVAAINGDFVDIETALTESMGEPEGIMIQNGAVLKSYFDPVTGRGFVGVRPDGTVIYHTAGQGYEENGYGTDYRVSSKYVNVKVLDEGSGGALADYYAAFGDNYSGELIYLSTEHSGERDLSGRTVYVVECDSYRHSHVIANGVEGGALGTYVYGKIVDIRAGKKNDKAEKGYAFICVPKRTDVEELKIGATIRCQSEMNGDWADVINAVGFKQQILAEGNILLKNCYGTYNQNGDLEETLVWTADIYDYPYCWKNRTLLGFREDGTPVLLVVARSSGEGAYHNLGASYYESGEQLKSLGCTNGFLLDGGGSSTFVIRGGDGSFSNVFVGEGDGRAVGNAVILAVRDKSVSLPEDETTASAETSSAPETFDEQKAPDGKNGFLICMSAVICAAAIISIVISVKNKKKKGG